MKFGNSFEVVGQTLGGVSDDHIVEAYGIPTITSELGDIHQYSSDHFTCLDKAQAYEIISQN
jgi:hypothetical protein